MIKITLDDTHAQQQLSGIIKQLKHPRNLYGVLGETLKKIHDARFDKEVDPKGRPWKPLATTTLARKAKKRKSPKILRQDGYLSTTTAYNYDDKKVEFGSGVRYARLHQFGGRAGRGRKVTIPARPWLGASLQDEQLLLKKATAALKRQIDSLR